MSSASLATAERKLAAMLPGIVSALSYSAADVLGKVVFNDGMDVLSFITTRGVLTVLFFWFWLRGAPPARPHTRRERIISIALGLMFSANIFALLLAIKLLPLSIAILTYFIYPLLTGLAGAATGIDRVGLRGVFAALAALIGLSMMLASPPQSAPPCCVSCRCWSPAPVCGTPIRG
jgi:drug/metabolite transporter (DMT)-like permease